MVSIALLLSQDKLDTALPLRRSSWTLNNSITVYLYIIDFHREDLDTIGSRT